MKYIPLLLLAGLLGFTSAQAQSLPPSSLWHDLEAGPYAVGFEVRYLFDTARAQVSTDDSAGRPLRLMIWYPASNPRRGQFLHFADYLHVAPEDERFTHYNDLLRARDLDTAQRQFTGALADSLATVLFATPTAAYAQAAPADGAFPLVLHSLGRNDFQQESTVLWEYLASHGYVVAVVPQLGASLAQHRMDFTAPDLDIQLQDVAFAQAALIKMPYVDPERIAILGHSSGGLVALLLASQNRQIDAIVGLDGSFTTEDGRDLLRAIPWHPEKVRVPILNLHTASKPRFDRSVLDSLTYADRYHVAYDEALHFDFQNWPLYATLTNAPDARAAAYRSPARGRDVFLSVCRVTLHFLDAVLKEDATALSYVKGDTPSNEEEGILFRFDQARRKR